MKKKSGFTLIEILVVVFIIGLLASIVIVSVNEARKKARDSRRVADLFEVRNALEMYFNQYQHYPKTTNNYGDTFNGQWRTSAVDAAYDGNGHNPNPDWVDKEDTTKIKPVFITSLPLDPINWLDTTKHICYAYHYGSNGKDYKMMSCAMESRAGGDKAANDGGYYNSCSTLPIDGSCSYELYSANGKSFH